MIIFLFLIETICCDPSSEPSRRDGSDEGSQHMFLCRINKNYPLLSPNTPSYLARALIKAKHCKHNIRNMQQYMHEHL